MEEKHPFILSKHSWLTVLIVQKDHKKNAFLELQRPCQKFILDIGSPGEDN